MKTRLDVYLTENGYFSSRQKAQAAIMAGEIKVNGLISDKAGNTVKEDDIVEVKINNCPYVSRGGFKLEKAIKAFGIRLEGLTCLDIGASTGGFTDCMLQNGAVRVYSIDVGTNQLDWKLRSDPRVVSMEKLNFRYLVPGQLPEKAEFASADVSFISLKLILPPASSVLKYGAEMVCLVKPQFEAGREQVGKNGIVKDPKVHEEVLKNAFLYAKENEFSVLGLDFSPITGAKGNIEYLMHLRCEKKDYADAAISSAGGKDKSIPFSAAEKNSDTEKNSASQYISVSEDEKLIIEETIHNAFFKLKEV